MKPLTDDQIMELFDMVYANLEKDENLYLKFARALEQLYGIYK
jgi:hypothetical protein